MWEEEERRMQEEEEWRIWEEEEQWLHLISKQQKKWVAELAVQQQQEWMTEERMGGSLKSRGT